MKRVLLGFAITASLAAQSQSGGAVNVGGANLPAQKIGANDLIAIAVYDAPEFTRTVRVGADGKLRLPMLKLPIQAEGLMPTALEQNIAGVLEREQILVDPVVTVTLVEYNSRPISVAGAVKNTITFQAIGAVSLLEALTRAGGLSLNAGPEILVSRTQVQPDGAPTTLTRRIKVTALINDADPSANVKLYGGEEVRVPEAAKLFVIGNVKKPGAYPVQDATESTVLRMLAMAEGLTPYAANQAFVLRQDDAGGKCHEIPIELKRILDRRIPDVPLMANDVLYIPDNSGRRRAANVLDRLSGFGASTASGVLIWRR